MMDININQKWTDIIMEEWSRLGVGLFVISPGSRSTPLALAAAAHKKLRYLMHFDERGASFVALGWGKISATPAVLICTSGTALAHYYPAVIESKQSGIPLIIMSADRPPELQNIEANQTIDQLKLYGGYVDHAFSFPCPSAQVPLTYILSQIDQAYYLAMNGNAGRAGPVHLNCPFRESLTHGESSTRKKLLINKKSPAKDQTFFDSPALEIDRIKKWHSCDIPFTDFQNLSNKRLAYSNKFLVDLLKKAKKPLILLGQLDAKEQGCLKKITDQSHAYSPIYTETFLLGEEGNVLDHLDLWISDISADETPDFVLHLGGKIISKSLGDFLSSYTGTYIQVGGFFYKHDPYLLGGHKISDSICEVMEFFISHSKKNWQEYGKILQKRDMNVKEKLSNYFKSTKTLSEGFLFHHWGRQEYFGKKKHLLYLGNSLPVRDFISYSDKRGEATVLVNRGASGIDGQLASVFGAITYSKRPALVVLGDLSFLHDLNSLALFSQVKTPVLIIVINNNGGGIFHHLPGYQESPYFKEILKTPHNLNFKYIAKQFSMPYQLVKQQKDCLSHLRLPRKGTALLEVKIDALDNLNLRRLF